MRGGAGCEEDGLTFVAACQAEGGDGPDDAEDIVREQSDDLALGGIGSQEGETRATGRDDLLLLGARELAQDSLGDGRRRLDGQGVQKHVGCGRHLDF